MVFPPGGFSLGDPCALNRHHGIQKGQGNHEGQKPEPKVPPKCQQVEDSSSENDDGGLDQQVILTDVTALEEAQVLSPGGFGLSRRLSIQGKENPESFPEVL